MTAKRRSPVCSNKQKWPTFKNTKLDVPSAVTNAFVFCSSKNSLYLICVAAKTIITNTVVICPEVMKLCKTGGTDGDNI